jgi:hypothetical protein
MSQAHLGNQENAGVGAAGKDVVDVGGSARKSERNEDRTIYRGNGSHKGLGTSRGTSSMAMKSTKDENEMGRLLKEGDNHRYHQIFQAQVRDALTKNPRGYDLRLLKRIFQRGLGPEMAMPVYKAIMERRLIGRRST